jgi:hypothetical protein
MKQHSARWLFRTVVMALVAVAVSSCPVRAQRFDSMLAETRAQLDALRFCLGLSFFPLQVLEVGLLRGYGGGSGSYGRGSDWEPPPPPAEYSRSLDEDVKACQAASRLKGEQKQELLEYVRRDVAIKAADCKKFGMGRMVSVRVTTVRGPQMDDGWEVYYKWDCSSAFQPKEIRAAKLTNPAVLQVPPGNYLVRAQKQLGGQMLKTEQTRVAVGMEKSGEVQLPIP